MYSRLKTLILVLGAFGLTGLLFDGCTVVESHSSGVPLVSEQISSQPSGIAFRRIESLSSSWLATYEDRTPLKDADFLAAQARRVGVLGQVSGHGPWLFIHDGKATASLDTAAGQVYFHLPQANPTGEVPDEADGWRIASSFVARLGLGVKIGRWYCTTTESSVGSTLAGTPTTTVRSRDYVFRRSVDGFPAFGPGNRVIVTVGPGGFVTDGMIDWDDFEPVGRVRIKTLAEAGPERARSLQRLENGPTPFGTVQGFKPDAVGLSYVTQHGPSGAVLVPAYCLRGLLISSSQASPSEMFQFVNASSGGDLSFPSPSSAIVEIPPSNPHR